MNKALYLITSVALLSSCTGNSSDESNQTEATVAETVIEQPTTISPSTSYQYTVISRQESAMPLANNQEIKKMTYTVEIPEEYSLIALNEIADVIKNEDQHEYVFIEYYLSSQPKSGLNYAISKRTPIDNNTTINYIAPPEPETSAVETPYDGAKVYGKWSMPGATVIAYQKKGKVYMVNHYGGSKYGDPERYIKTTYGGRIAFKNAEDPNDMYVINSDGDLDGYFEYDLVTTFPQTF